MNVFSLQEEKKLDDLKQKMYQCRDCYLGEINNPCNVFGEGPLNAEIMSIAEAPGATEQQQGRPLVGQAGKFWEGMLLSIGWSREHIYVTNAVKGRPMYGGRSNTLSPNLEEVWACQHFLIKQVQLVKPKLLLVFGKPAALSLGILTKETYGKPVKNKLGLQKAPYQYIGLDGYKREAKVLWTYHPSYLMSKPDGRNYCFQAYKQLSDAKKLLEADISWDG